MPLLGLDIGTTGCKASLFDEEGRLLAAEYREYPLEQPFPGAYELSPARVWEAVQAVVYGATRSAPGAKVDALSLSSLGEAFVPVDAEGRALGNALLYTDARGTEQAKALERAIGGERTMALTGVPPHPMFSLPKAMWIKANDPELYRRTWKFMLFADYVAFLLTGVAATDYTLASRTMAFDVSAKRWSPEMLGAADVEEDKWAEPVPSGTVLGTVRPGIAMALGLSSDTVVAAGGHDQACAALGAGILKEGLAIDGIGTVECITPAYSDPLLNETMLRHRYNCAPHVVEGLYLTYAFNFTGGSLLKWYRNQFGRLAEEEARNKGLGVYDYLSASAPEGPTDLLVVPHFAGSGTPYMNPESKGVVYGLTLDTTASQLYRALLEGVTYEMRYNAECLAEAGIAISSLRAVGGGAKSDLWLQIKADIMGLPIERLNVGEAGTIGNIMLAGKASGAYSSYEEAAIALVKPVRTFYPGELAQAAYEERYEKYKALSKAVSAIG